MNSSKEIFLLEISNFYKSFTKSKYSKNIESKNMKSLKYHNIQINKIYGKQNSVKFQYL